MEPEGATSLLDREINLPKTKEEHAKKMLDIREDFRKIEYSKKVEQESKGELPTTVKALRDALDEKARDLIINSKVEKDHEENVPDVVVRDQSEKEWTEIGWEREKRNRVIEKLKQILGVNEAKAMNIVHMLVATGKDADTVFGLLDQEKYTNKLSNDYYLNTSTYTDPRTGQPVINPNTEKPIDIGAFVASQIDSRYVQTLDRETANKYLLLSEELGLKELDKYNNNNTQTYLMRFVLDEEFKGALDYEFDTELPQNLYDLAWNIQYHEQHFAVNGEFPILQMQIDRDKKTGKITGGRYVVNQANFVRWLRERMYYRWDAFETDEVPDYYSVIAVHKGQYATVNLATMIFDKDRYFRDETGHSWDILFNEVFIEPFDLIWERRYAVEHQQAYDKGDDFPKMWEQWARLSKFTRKINGQSMLDRAMMLATDYQGRTSDTRVGEALLTMYLAYYNLADFEGLKKYLGEDSPFFTRDAWVKAAADFAGGGTAGSGGIKASGMLTAGSFFGESQKYFDKAFDKDGNVSSINDFLLFINPNWHEYPPQNLEKVLAQVLQNSVRDKFVSKEGNKEGHEDPIDDFSLQYAWLKAYSWIGFTGARARNNFKPDGSPSGHHQETRLIYTDAYRMKYETFGGAGNLYTVPMFKQLSVPFFEGTLSETAQTDYKVGNKTETRNLTQMEVMLKLRESDLQGEAKKKKLTKEYEERKRRITSDAEMKALAEQYANAIEYIDEEHKYLHKQYASQLEFNDNAMLVYSKNMIGMANPLYDRVMKAKETSFDKFITYDGIFRGPSFHREEWQDALQSKLFTPLRYIFEANGATQLNQIVRAPVYMGKKDGKDVWEWKEQYLGERMIGHQVLDIETFWKRAKDVPKEEWDKKLKMGYRKRRGFIIRPDGKHEIDYNRVQNNKSMVYKQWMLMKLAADLWAHIDRHSTDPMYTLEHYEDIVDAIKNLPGDFAGDEFDMKGVRNTKTLFSKHQLHWLERMSGKNGLFFRTFVSDVFMGDKKKKDSALGESTGIILAGIFKGY